MAFPTTGLVAYWKLDANSNDSKGSNNGSDTSVSYASAGKISNAATFNGTTSKIAIADNASIDFGTGSFSFSAWVKTSATQGSIWGGRASGSGPQMGMVGGKLYSDGVGTAGITTSASINTGSFVHIAFVWDRGGSLLRTYVNGTADNTVALGATSATQAITKYLGDEGGPGELYGKWNGAIDEVGWWNVALSSGDITSLYNGGAGVTYSPSTNVSVNATVVSATFTPQAPTFSNATPVSVSPAVQAATFSVPSATITAVKNVAIAAAVLALTFSTPGGSANTGATLPTSATNTGTGGDWGTPTNILVATDAASAFYQTGTASKDLLGSAFGFAIPSDAIINGIELQLRGIQPDGSYSVNVYIYKGGSRAGTPTTAGFSSGLAMTVTKGSSSDLWGTTWTPAEINATGFGAAVASPGNSNLTSIYWMKTTVYYTASGVTVTTTSTATITPAVQSIVASTQAPTIKFDYTVSPSVVSATFSTQAPTVASSSDVSVSPSVQSTTFTTQAPAVTAIQNVSVTASVVSATFSSQSPAVAAGVAAGPAVQSATFSTQAPSVSTTSTVSVSASVAAATFSTQTPSIALDYAVGASTPTATFSIQAPAVTVTKTVNVSAAAVAAVFLAQSPAIKLDYALTTNVLTATFAVPAVAVSNASNVAVSSSVQSVTAAVQVPAVITASVLFPAVQTAAFAVTAVALRTDQVLFPAAQSPTFSVQSPTIVLTVSVSVSASVSSIIAAVPTPTISAGVTFAAFVQTITTSAQHPSIFTDQTLSPQAQSLTFFVIGPSVATSIALSVGVSAMVVSAQSPIVSLGCTAFPNVFFCTFSIPSVTIIAAPPRMRLGVAVLTTKDPEKLVLKSEVRVLRLGTNDNKIIL